MAKLLVPPPPARIFAEIRRRAEALSWRQSSTPEILVLGSNYRGVFHHVETDLGVFGVRVIRPPSDADWAQTDLRKHLPVDLYIALVTTIGATVALLTPLAAVIGELVALGLSLKPLWASVDKTSEALHAELLRNALRQLAREESTVLLIDAVDRPGREVLWTTALWTIHYSEVRGLQVVVGTEGPPQLSTPGGEDTLRGWPPVLGDIRYAAERGRADWEWIAPLDQTRVRTWLGSVDHSLAQRLLSVSGGDDLRAGHIWNRWVESRHAVRGQDGVWRRGGTVDPFDDDIHTVISTRVPPLEQARSGDLIELAAAFGLAFSATAVCQVAFQHGLGTDPEDLEELLDLVAKTDTPGPWLVQTTDSVETTLPDGEIKYHWVYRFASQELHQHLRSRRSESERTILSGELLDAALEAHGMRPEVDAMLADLARHAGRPDEAAALAIRADTHSLLHHVTTYAALLLDAARHGADPLLLDKLSDVTYLLVEVGKVVLGEATGRAAVGMVSDATDLPSKGRAHRVYGLALLGAGRQSAVDQLRIATSVLQGLYLDQPTPEHLRDLAITLGELGRAHVSQGDTGPAIPYLEDARRHFETLYEDQPAELERDLAIILSDLGNAYLRRGQPELAIPHLEEASHHFERLYQNQPTPKHHRDLAIVLGDLGNAYVHRGEPERAIPRFEDARRHYETLYQNQPTPEHHRDVVIVLGDLGNAYTKHGEPGLAIPLLEEARRHVQRLYQAQPTPEHERNLCFILRGLGNAYVRHGEPGPAIPLLEEARRHHEMLYQSQSTLEDERNVSIILGDLGDAHDRHGEPEIAIQLLEEARRRVENIYRNQPSPEHQYDYAHILRYLGKAHVSHGEPELAIPLLEEARRHHETLYQNQPTPGHYRDLSITLGLLDKARRSIDGT
jgi:tetratricopeptide (TPR) repeat protein